MYLLPGLRSGAAECLAANSVSILSQERVEARPLGLFDHPFGKDVEETLEQEETSVGQQSKCRAFNPQTSVLLIRVLDRGGPHGGSALERRLRGLAQRAPSLAKREELR